MFARLRAFTQDFARHRHVEWWLFFYAIIESVFFPVPPDVLLIALALSRPQHAVRFATIAAIGSVVGGLVGYAIGRYAFEPIAAPVLNFFCKTPDQLICTDVFVPKLEQLFDKHGPWVVGVSAMSPVIPYRLTILAAGLAHMALIPFIGISLIMHWARYALVSWSIARYGARALHLVRDQLPLAFAAIGGLALVIYSAINYF